MPVEIPDILNLGGPHCCVYLQPYKYVLKGTLPTCLASHALNKLTASTLTTPAAMLKPPYSSMLIVN
jgi:hypothetical protein